MVLITSITKQIVLTKVQKICFYYKNHIVKYVPIFILEPNNNTKEFECIF